MNPNTDIPERLRPVGLLPAGGAAHRISPLPCSKEIYPVGMRLVDNGVSLRPKVAAHHLLEKMKRAGADSAYIILGDGKWDIPAYLKHGGMVAMHLAYLMMDRPYGVPYTLDQAYAFIADRTILFGFPDIVFKPDSVFTELLSRQHATQADITLGLFPADNPHKMDMVELDADGSICGLAIKPVETHLRYTWIAAVWSPAFTAFMHRFVLVDGKKREAGAETLNNTVRDEVYVGDVIAMAIDKGLKVETIIFDDGVYLDIGTPEDLVRASQFTNEFPEVEP